MSRKDTILVLRQGLVTRRGALKRALAGDLGLLKELTRPQIPGDTMDAAQDSANGEIGAQMAQAEAHELARIELALVRMQNGLYGICDSCDCVIPLDRMEAVPCATLCIACQREAERESD